MGFAYLGGGGGRLSIPVGLVTLAEVKEDGGEVARRQTFVLDVQHAVKEVAGFSQKDPTRFAASTFQILMYKLLK